MDAKLEVDSTPGCRVRGVLLDNKLVGWCGIQFDNGKYEVAIVIDQKSWGVGRAIFNDLIAWAKEFKHEEVYINFLHTRPRYRFLSKKAKSVTQTEMLGNTFTSYQFSVE
ncbi:GNAT family N-acetyltransferase [Microbulbifer donghaiensis]|uniref:GNAT family N-acetyltransferase n=1 Tax=Microbulbifer donghaiensis TaxID=494016 RepID=UPI001160F597|nr:GNAT family N-acetyltransferase [Microbulbifer donghaiensis]